MSFNYILTGDTTLEAVDKMNENFSGTSGIWSSGTGDYSFITLNDTNNISTNDYSFVGGKNSESNGLFSFSYGENCISDGDYSFSFGYSGTSIGNHSMSIGFENIANGNYSFASGYQTQANGIYSFSSGYQTKANGNYSYAQGYKNIADGDYSFAGGYNSIASGFSSFVYSKNSLITGDRSVIIGGENITGTSDDTVYVPSLKIDTVDSQTSTVTKLLAIDSNNNVVARDYVTSSSSSFNWQTIQDTDIYLSPNNGYVSKVTGAYSESNFNLFTMPSYDVNDNGKIIKIANEENTITKIYFPNLMPLICYNEGSTNDVILEENKYLWIFEYEYIEFIFANYNIGLGGSVFRNGLIINKFITNKKTSFNANGSLQDMIIDRITTT
jgi:hypothetical protein